MAANEVRLEHALLCVRDLERSLAFYRRVFPEWGIRWDGRVAGDAWVHWGPPGDGQPGYLSLSQAADPAGTLSHTGSRGVDHIGFAHPDVAGLVARLTPLGIAPADRTEDDRFRRVYFRDPDGYKLEFVQQLR
jgi:catechol 2,3-dioxygenase-like lactoylglutathione lyase family enzyme